MIWFLFKYCFHIDKQRQFYCISVVNEKHLIYNILTILCLCLYVLAGISPCIPTVSFVCTIFLVIVNQHLISSDAQSLNSPVDGKNVQTQYIMKSSFTVTFVCKMSVAV